MSDYTVYFNLFAENGRSEEAKRLGRVLNKDTLHFYDMTKIISDNIF